MSSSSSAAAGPSSKADQLVYRFFVKAVHVLCSARLTGFDASVSAKPDKWFNLDAPSADWFKDELSYYRHLSSFNEHHLNDRFGSRVKPEPSMPTDVPALILEFVLDTSAVGDAQVLVLEGQDGRKGTVRNSSLTTGRKEKLFVVERWRIALDTSVNPASNIALSSTYKRLIPLMRSLHAIMRLFPAHRLHRRIRGGRGAAGLRIGARAYLEGQDVPSDTCVPLEKPIGVEGVHEGPLERWHFDGVEHTYGMLSIKATYRPNVHFRLEDKDSIASSHLLEDIYFTPTMVHHRSSSSSQGSPAPITASLPSRSPELARSPALPVAGSSIQRTRYGSVSSRAMVESLSGSQRRGSFGAAADPTGATAMERKSSDSDVPTGMAIGPPRERRPSYFGEDQPSSPSSLSLSRRPSVIQPFKTGTLSSSPNPSTMLVRASPSPSSSLQQTRPSGPSSLSREVAGKAEAIPIVRPLSSASPYPPLPPSSASSQPGSSADPASIPLAPSLSKRYSSSFGHRQGRSFSALSDASGSVSPAARPIAPLASASFKTSPMRRDTSVASSSFQRKSYLTMGTSSSVEEDDDLAAFVRLIDSRPTLQGPFAFGTGSSTFLPSPAQDSSMHSSSTSQRLTGGPAAVTTKQDLSRALQRLAGSYTGGLPPAPSSSLLAGVSGSSYTRSSPLSASPPSALPHRSSTMPGSSPSPPRSGSPPIRRPSITSHFPHLSGHQSSSGTSPIAPSPLRSSTEPPTLHRPSYRVSPPPLSTEATSPPSFDPATAAFGPSSSSSGPSDTSPPPTWASRRKPGPVLMRGGFGPPSLPSSSSSPAHSPSSQPLLLSHGPSSSLSDPSLLLRTMSSPPPPSYPLPPSPSPRFRLDPGRDTQEEVEDVLESFDHLEIDG